MTSAKKAAVLYHRVLFRGITELWVDNFESRSRAEIEDILTKELASGKYRGEDGELFSDILPDLITDWEFTVVDPNTGEHGEWISVHDPDSED